MDNLILSNLQNNVLHITINRFDKKNALNSKMYLTLCDLLASAATNDKVNSVLIQGNESCFCAGNDLADFIKHANDDDLAAFQFVKALVHFNKPLIAAVAGPAVGIGTTMLLHCDYVIATKDAKLKLPFSQLGLCPEAASSTLLPLKLGHNKAFELLVLGDTFSGQYAHDIGLVNKITSDETLLSDALAVAEKIAKLPADATQTSRRLIKQATQPQVLKAIEQEAIEFSRLIQTNDCQQILQRFFN
ncbi:enoyl-CoA hydratase [Thalassotalea sp. PP2-459]|uniref:enoyl-CoA hydratase n=1 Tax=Thalassotalea sp. PP2-459 TaxID=1742724 RepID=UPI000942EDC7|nr:enoyl-CoA hydratase [Thalassotalea sp. PP2-459]OKY24821.1 crotonase [Thalassotalea sp. PP2-459]